MNFFRFCVLVVVGTWSLGMVILLAMTFMLMGLALINKVESRALEIVLGFILVIVFSNFATRCVLHGLSLHFWRE